MKVQRNLLPDRFPLGTRYVVEGCAGPGGTISVQSRYVEFPDGRHVDLPLRGSDSGQRRRPREQRGASKRKISVARNATASPTLVA